MTRQVFLAAVLVGASAAMAVPAPAVVSAAASRSNGVALAQSDLDEFMRQVLAHRDENWKKLQQYVLDEKEKMEVVGPQLVRIMGTRREYRWFIKDGFFVRSPVAYDGVPVADVERRKFEDDYLRQAKEREKRAASRADATASVPGLDVPQSDSSVQASSPTDVEGLLAQTRQPQFISSAYFLRFKFEQGKYALVGREQFDGRAVLRIEYYPERLFTDNHDKAARTADAKKSPPPDQRQDLEVERLMNKNSLVTLWVEPGAKQIVKFAFDNVQTDFLPISWFFRLNDLKASMTMSQPFKDVWLPRDVDVLLSAMLAIGVIDLRYHLDYLNYAEATTSGRIIRGGRQ